MSGAVISRLKPMRSNPNVDDIADMLEGADMFRDFNRDDVETLAKYVGAYEAGEGTKVLDEGSRESYMFVVIEGKMDILKQNEGHGEGKKIATVRAGKTVGEMSLIDGLPHSATAVVADSARLLLFTKDDFERFAEECPDVAIKVLRKIASLMSLRLRQTSGVLLDYLGH